jgi:hypothetical protein
MSWTKRASDVVRGEPAVRRDSAFQPVRACYDLVRDGRAITVEAGNLLNALGELREGVYGVHTPDGVQVATTTSNGDGVWRMTGGRRR